MRLILIFLFAVLLNGEKIKDISNIVGLRENQLIGYGLVVGLSGTGDGSSSTFTTQAMSNMLSHVDIKVDAKMIKSKNIAAVVVTAKLPSFTRIGDKLDIQISSMGDAKSLEGGTLLLTPLKGVDGEIYALAQGAVTLGGKSGKGDTVEYHLTVGKVPQGALVEKEIANTIFESEGATLSLMDGNLKNAIAIQNELNDYFSASLAKAVDARTIKLIKPSNLSMVEFLAKVQDVEIRFSKDEKIIIDEKTGTIIAGINIRVDPIVITHGALTIKIAPRVQLPEANDSNQDLGEGVMINKNENLLFTQDERPTIADITRALQKLGQSPKDIVAIFLAIKDAGAIRAKIEVL